MSERRPKVLVVDDEALIARLFSIHMESMGFDVCATAASADEAVVKAEQHRPDIILMDVRLRGAKDGIDAAQSIRETQNPKIIFVTGSTDPATMARIGSHDLSSVLVKPVAERQLKAAVDQAIRR